MRRHFAMALGGCLAVTAVGLAQQAAPVRTPAPVQYQTPYAVAPQRADAIETADPRMAGQQIQPVAGPGTPVNGGQYVPVQPIQTYTIAPNSTGAVQYVPVQPVQTTQTQIAPVAQPSSSLAMPMPALPAEGVQTIGGQGYVLQSQGAPTRPSTPAPPAANQPNTNQPNQNNQQRAPQQQQQAGQPQQQGGQPQPGAIAGPGCASGNCANICNSCNNGCGACQNIFNSGCNSGCGNCQQTCCNPCGPCGRVWFSAEYLLWWTRGMGIPALVSSSVDKDIKQEQAGVFGDPSTIILYGDNRINDGLTSGFRLRAGGWFDCCQTCGIEGSYFFLGDQDDSFSADGKDYPVLARPFYNVDPKVVVDKKKGAVADSQLIDYPDLVDGVININSNTSFTGFDINFRKNWCCDACNRIDVLAGFRYLRLTDDINIGESLTVLSPFLNTPQGTSIQLSESFCTKNQFYGAQVGLAGEHRRCGGIYFGWRALIGFGTTSKDASIAGETAITTPGKETVYYNGGLLALPTNIGKYSRNDFSVVPELGLTAGYQVNNCIRVFAGYSFLYWSNVTRAGDIIDLVVNGSQIPPGTLFGPARPTFHWQNSDFWAQGISFGAEVRY